MRVYTVKTSNPDLRLRVQPGNPHTIVSQLRTIDGDYEDIDEEELIGDLREILTEYFDIAPAEVARIPAH